MLLFSERCDANHEAISYLRRSLRHTLSEIRMSHELVDELQLIMMEIAANTIDHTTAQSPSFVEVRVSIKGAMVVLEVHDDGRIFDNYEAFFDSDTRSLESVSGLQSAAEDSGRGIEIVKDLADRISYLPGPPNRFIAWCKLAKRQPVVLLVEDDPALAKSYAIALYPTYKTIVVDGVANALIAMGDNQVDLLVVDYHLADGTGQILTETLERSPNRLPLPVIMVTGDKSQDLQRKMLEMGVEVVLQKPVSTHVLEDSIRLELQRSERRRASHFRHFGIAAAKLLSGDMPACVGSFDIGQHNHVADLGSGDALLHLSGAGRERLVLMDVMGHGLGAHSSAIAIAAVVRALHLQVSEQPPNVLLSRLSDTLFCDLTLGQLFCTMVVIDLMEGNRIEIASAGHPTPALVRESGVMPLEVGGPIPGFAAEAPYDVAAISLAKGERVFLFTDGLDPAGLAAGDDLPTWLLTSLGKSLNLDMSAAIDAIAADVRGVLGPEPEDDWTVLAVQGR